MIMDHTQAILVEAVKRYNVNIDIMTPRAGCCIHKPDELHWLLDKMLKVGTRRNLLEIGLCAGGSFLIWSTMFDRVCSLDIDTNWIKNFRDAYPEFDNSPNHLILDAHSQHPKTVAKVKEFFGGEPLDVLFIDGSHAYAHVIGDYLSYRPMVRPGGLIVFHDACHGHELCEVPRFVRELKSGWFDGEQHDIEVFCCTADPNQPTFTIDDFGVAVEVCKE